MSASWVRARENGSASLASLTRARLTAAGRLEQHDVGMEDGVHPQLPFRGRAARAGQGEERSRPVQHAPARPRGGGESADEERGGKVAPEAERALALVGD